MTASSDITADAIALQERDEFRAAGWLKAIAPAKVNLHLAIGTRRDDGYHDALSIMHALALHDVVYLRRAVRPMREGCSETTSPSPSEGASAEGLAVPVTCTMIGCGDVEAPAVAAEDNLAVKAARMLAEACGLAGAEAALDIRIEKNIPAQAGLGGGSTDAAAVLVGAARLWDLAADDPRIETCARRLGADVAFFLRGGCVALGGTGDEFLHALAPSQAAVALVKPEGGVSTAEAYRTFDGLPAAATAVPADVAANALGAERASELVLFNNLAPAAEQLRGDLADVRRWIAVQPGADGALLCGSGAATFAPCSDFASAARIVAAARARGWWARTTSFASLGATVVSGAEGAAAGEAATRGPTAGDCASERVAASRGGKAESAGERPAANASEVEGDGDPA